jgi:CRP-like cAMP-binding protein
MAADDERVREVLRSGALFSDVTIDALDELVRGGSRRRYAAGETICRAEDAADSCFVVLDGLVRLTMGGQTIAEVGTSVAISEAAVWDGGPRGVDGEAATEVDLLELPAAAMLRLVERDSGFAKHMLAYVVGVARRSVAAS